jgi:LPXTG-motif cell wall-anchored protein
MKTLLKYSLLALALAFSTSAFAQQGGWNGGGGNGGGWNSPPPGCPPPNNNVAPEVDPSLALSGFTLLGGALTVLRSRRRK